MRITTLLVIALLCGAACGPGQVDPTMSPHERIEAAVKRVPRLPVVVPVERPGSYELVDHEGGVTFDGRVLESAWTYRAEGEDLPDIEVCVLRPRTPPLCGTNDEALAVHRVGGLRVFLRPVGSGSRDEAAEVWSDVRFTEQWQTVTWLLE